MQPRQVSPAYLMHESLVGLIFQGNTLPGFSDNTSLLCGFALLSECEMDSCRRAWAMLSVRHRWSCNLPSPFHPGSGPGPLCVREVFVPSVSLDERQFGAFVFGGV